MPKKTSLYCVLDVTSADAGRLSISVADYDPTKISAPAFYWNNQEKYFRALGEAKDLQEKGMFVNV